MRNAADYQLSLSGPSCPRGLPSQALADAEAAVALLDALEANSAGVRRQLDRSPRKKPRKNRDSSPKTTARRSRSNAVWLRQTEVVFSEECRRIHTLQGRAVHGGDRLEAP